MPATADKIFAQLKVCGEASDWKGSAWGGLAQGHQVWLVWKEFDGQRVRVWLRQSADAGRSWTPDRAVAETAGTSDHPQLLAWPPGAGGVQLSWMTRQEGLRLLPLPPPQPSPPPSPPDA